MTQLPVVPNKKYTLDQITDIIKNNPGVEDLKMLGYVLRTHDDGMISFVLWKDASNAQADKGPVSGRTYTQAGAAAAMKAELPAIVKRTPQQRIDSLMKRWVDQCRASGTIPGMTETEVNMVLGEGWRLGVSEMTAEDVRRLAAKMLQDSETKFEAAESKKTVRTSPTD